VEYEKHVDKELGKSSIALTIINCTPGSMCIVPDRCNITYDRRFPPTETPESCIAQIQKIVDKLSDQDPEFRATVSIGAVERVSYTGKAVTMENKKEAWKLEVDHPVTKACAKGLMEVGQEVKYGYWDFGTDMPVTHAQHDIPSIGYSPMQEFYCHRPVDKVRIDYMEKALSGNVALFIELSQLEKEKFKL
jgi:acetylornithine deacetylase/succinyl-diaminopimelate desuccinylase-like protein